MASKGLFLDSMVTVPIKKTNYSGCSALHLRLTAQQGYAGAISEASGYDTYTTVVVDADIVLWHANAICSASNGAVTGVYFHTRPDVAEYGRYVSFAYETRDYVQACSRSEASSKVLKPFFVIDKPVCIKEVSGERYSPRRRAGAVGVNASFTVTHQHKVS